jgi:hypothetical protein
LEIVTRRRSTSQRRANAGANRPDGRLAADPSGTVGFTTFTCGVNRVGPGASDSSSTGTVSSTGYASDTTNNASATGYASDASGGRTAYTSSAGSATPPMPQSAPSPSGCPQGCVSPPTGCPIKGNVSTDTRERIYHVPGGQFYSETIIDASRGERWFCTEEEARNNGWRRSLR